MNAPGTPDVLHLEASPPLPQGPRGEGGLALAVGRDSAGAQSLHGSFRVELALLGLVRRPLQRHIVLVSRRRHRPMAHMPWRDLLLFAEDDAASQGFAYGYFNVGLRAALGARAEAGGYTCFASLGPWLSNALRVELG